MSFFSNFNMPSMWQSFGQQAPGFVAQQPPMQIPPGATPPIMPPQGVGGPSMQMPTDPRLSRAMELISTDQGVDALAEQVAASGAPPPTGAPGDEEKRKRAAMLGALGQGLTRPPPQELRNIGEVSVGAAAPGRSVMAELYKGIARPQAARPGLGQLILGGR